MHPARDEGAAGETAARVVGRAIQDLTAARLGRAFLPLAVGGAVGLGEVLVAGAAGPGGWILLLGAPVTAGAMLAYGLRGVRLAFGRPSRPWMAVAAVGGLVPLFFGTYVLGWRGLRTMARGDGASLLVGAGLALLGVWILRAWLRVVEVRRLAEAMTGTGEPEGGGP